MAWAKAHIEIKPASIGTGIKATLSKKKSPARLRLTVSEADAKAFGWAPDDRIEVLIGEDEHHGLIRIRKNNSTGQARADYRKLVRGAFFSVQLGHQPRFVDRSEPASWCQWETTEDGWIEIVLPKWASETNPKRAQATGSVPSKAVPPADARPAMPSPGRGASRSVTASLMGDPDPGRREAVEKLSRKEALERVGKLKA